MEQPINPFENTEPTIKVSDWFITQLLAGIPFIGLLFLLYWAASAEVSRNKQNWARAYLIWYLVALVPFLFFVFYALSTFQYFF